MAKLKFTGNLTCGHHVFAGGMYCGDMIRAEKSIVFVQPNKTVLRDRDAVDKVQQYKQLHLEPMTIERMHWLTVDGQSCYVGATNCRDWLNLHWD